MSKVYEVYKGDTPVGIILTGQFVIGQLVGKNACDEAGVAFDEPVKEMDINWYKLDANPDLDDQPWRIKEKRTEPTDDE